MADQELTELDLLLTLAAGDLFLVRDISAGKDKKIEASALVSLLSSGDLDDLGDVIITTPTAGQYLCFNGTTWVNAFIPIDDLSDVDTTTTPPTPGDVLTWDGTNWIPSMAGAPGAHAPTHLSGGVDEIDGDVLDIDFFPSVYVPTPAPPFSFAPFHLTSHLAGIDASLFTLFSSLSSHTHSFLSLSPDTPDSYAGSGSRFVKVNAGASALEFVADPGFLTGSSSLNDLSDVVLTTPTDGDYLCFDGVNWINSAINLDDLNDVDAPTPSAGDFLRFDGGSWENFAPTFASSLNELSDVVLTSPTAGQYLCFNGTTWVNAFIPINDLSDVDTVTTPPVPGDCLKWDGTNWVPAASATPGLHAASHLSGAIDEIDGDKLDIDFVPANYASTTVAPFTTSTQHLTSHLKGIDNALGTFALTGHTHTFLELTDTPVSYATHALKFVKVNAGATVLEFVADPGYLTGSSSLNDLSDVILTSPSAGQYLCFNGTTWVNAFIPINDLSDVDTATTPPVSGDVLSWNGTNWVPVASDTPGLHAASHISGGTDEIDGDRLDIDFVPTNYTRDTAPAEVTLVVELTAHLAGIDNALGTFALSGHTHTFLDLTDTPDTYVGAGSRFVKVNAGATGLEFVVASLAAISLDDLSDVVLTSPSSGQYLRFNGTNWVNAVITAGDITGLTDTIIVKDEGTTVTGGPHTALNFVGAGVTATDGGAGVATITIPGATGSTAKYDCQEAVSLSTASTDSTTYIDLGGMTLTTKDLSETGKYKLTFSCSSNCEKPNRTYRFRFVVGGTPTGEEFLNSSGTGTGATDEMNVSFSQVVSGVAFGTVVKVQFRIDDPSGANAVNVFERVINILGVPGSQVVV